MMGALARAEVSEEFAENAAVRPLVVMATENELTQSHVQLALRDMLFGWDESAQLHFRAAVEADDSCALAWLGLMLTEGVTEENRRQLETLLGSDDVAATPPEMSLLMTWLRLLRGERAGAGDEFAERAAQFRADSFSAYWAVLLLHDGYELTGKPRANQTRSLNMARELYERRPDDAYACYLRAWVEESAPEVSDEALAAARKAVTLMPAHPSMQLMLGHLLYRKGLLAEAIEHLREASSRAEELRKNVPCGTFLKTQDGTYPVECCPLEIRAKLYESTLLWISGKERESLLIQASLLKQMRSMESTLKDAPGAVLLRWEAATLPLRLLMLRPSLPSDAQVSAAAQAAMPAQAEKGDALLDVRDCLRFCVVARQRAAAGKVKQAIRCVEAADKSLKRLQEAETQYRGQGAHQLSAWTRACEACTQALLAAKAAAYPETACIWLQSLEQAQRPATLLMPPVLPKP